VSVTKGINDLASFDKEGSLVRMVIPYHHEMGNINKCTRSGRGIGQKIRDDNGTFHRSKRGLRISKMRRGILSSPRFEKEQNEEIMEG